MAAHFNSKEHTTTDIEFMGTESIARIDTGHSLESFLLTRETFWRAQFCTLF